MGRVSFHLLNICGGLEGSQEGVVSPYRFSGHLRVVSVGMLLHQKDLSVIWRRSLRISAVKHFISDIEWRGMDFLTIAHTMPDAEALIVTRPHEISLVDMRRSMNSCRQARLKIIGAVEKRGKIFFAPQDAGNRTVSALSSARESGGEHSMSTVLCKLTKCGYKHNINVESCRAEGT
jgi:hypothetical protein